MNRNILGMACAGALLPMGLAIAADEQVHQHMDANGGRGASKEVRQLVELPAPLLQRELADMRERLAVLGHLQAALSIEAYGEAADLAENHLGMSSFPMDGTQEVAKYMPQGMLEMGAELHLAASRFALELTNVGATGDIRPAIAALSEVMQRCVSCHTVYRFR
jgi:hypothetical protein